MGKQIVAVGIGGGLPCPHGLRRRRQGIEQQGGPGDAFFAVVPQAVAVVFKVQRAR